MRAASVGGGPTGLGAVLEGIDVAAEQTSRARQSVCGRGVHSYLSDCIPARAAPATEKV